MRLPVTVHQLQDRLHPRGFARGGVEMWELLEEVDRLFEATHVRLQMVDCRETRVPSEVYEQVVLRRADSKATGVEWVLTLEDYDPGSVNLFLTGPPVRSVLAYPSLVTLMMLDTCPRPEQALAFGFGALLGLAVTKEPGRLMCGNGELLTESEVERANAGLGRLLERLRPGSTASAPATLCKCEHLLPVRAVRVTAGPEKYGTARTEDQIAAIVGHTNAILAAAGIQLLQTGTGEAALPPESLGEVTGTPRLDLLGNPEWTSPSCVNLFFVGGLTAPGGLPGHGWSANPGEPPYVAVPDRAARSPWRSLAFQLAVLCGVPKTEEPGRLMRDANDEAVELSAAEVEAFQAGAGALLQRLRHRGELPSRVAPAPEVRAKRDLPVAVHQLWSPLHQEDFARGEAEMKALLEEVNALYADAAVRLRMTDLRRTQVSNGFYEEVTGGSGLPRLLTLPEYEPRAVNLFLVGPPLRYLLRERRTATIAMRQDCTGAAWGLAHALGGVLTLPTTDEPDRLLNPKGGRRLTPEEVSRLEWGLDWLLERFHPGSRISGRARTKPALQVPVQAVRVTRGGATVRTAAEASAILEHASRLLESAGVGLAVMGMTQAEVPAGAFGERHDLDALMQGQWFRSDRLNVFFTGTLSLPEGEPRSGWSTCEPPCLAVSDRATADPWWTLAQLVGHLCGVQTMTDTGGILRSEGDDDGAPFTGAEGAWLRDGAENLLERLRQGAS